METDGERGGGEAERTERSELGRLLEAIGSSEVLQKRIPLVKQLEEFSADDLGLILQGLLASWIDSTCSGVSHCTLHRSILQVALKCSDLDITDYLGQFFTLGAKASSWCGRHLQWSVKPIEESEVAQEEEHNRLHLEGLEVVAGEGGQGTAQEECVLNKADDGFPTLDTMAVEVEPAPAHLAVEATPWSLRLVLSPPTRLLHSNSGRPSKKRRLSTKENSAAGDDDMGALVEELPCGVRASLDAFFDHTFPSVSWEEAGPARVEEDEEEELEWLSNKDAFPSVETMAVEALDAPPARTKGRRRVTAAAVKPRRRCTRCGAEETPQWREGPEGAHTLCNACGLVFRKKGRLFPEYRPAFLPQLHSNSNKYGRALEMHSQNGPTSSSPPQRYRPLSSIPQSKEETSTAGVEACRGESMEMQPLPVPERPLADSPASSLLLRSRSRRRSEVQIVAAIRATAKAQRAERAAARLAAMDD